MRKRCFLQSNLRCFCLSQIGIGRRARARLQLSRSSNLATPIARGISPAECGMNQSVFIRGFKITLNSTSWFRYKPPVKVMDLSSGALKDLKPKNIVARGAPVSFNERPGRAAFVRPQPPLPPPPPSPAPQNNFNGSSGPGSLSPQWSSTNTCQNVSRCSEYEVGLFSDSDLDSGLGSDWDSDSDSDFQVLM
ncbi:hypothetical protein K435DRAFT_876978 [Dendrothele bispora CBS 962.96]|uniref:Uncharacterized protein n=1 Tax=Dendrothele bispora (strain CBS 962.96) TaxID=1314807 RepID=A0A4V4HB60_DENBC|nr:hypothetical protein K435DRAFT_876978 [Dendrothele bispora CBS 962.96]